MLYRYVVLCSAGTTSLAMYGSPNFANSYGSPCEFSLVNFEASSFCYFAVEVVYNAMTKFVRGYRKKNK